MKLILDPDFLEDLTLWVSTDPRTARRILKMPLPLLSRLYFEDELAFLKAHEDAVVFGHFAGQELA